MRILMVTMFPPPITGSSLASKMLADGLCKKHKVKKMNMMINTSFGNLREQGSLSLIKLAKSVFKTAVFSGQILFGEKFDIVYMTPGQTPMGFLKFLTIMWATRFRSTPYVIHIHGSYFRSMLKNANSWTKKIIENSVKKSSGAIVLGDSLRPMFKDLLPEEKIYTCPNGVEMELFATEEEIAEKTKRWRNDDVIRIVFLSNLMESKGILDLFESIRILKKKGTKVHLDVAGAIEPDVKDKVNDFLSKLESEVRYHGILEGEEKKNLLLKNYLFCLPSKHPFGEGQPISILEAMANGCGIVATDHGGIKEILDKSYGLVVEKDNPEDLAKTIIKAWRKNDIPTYSWGQAKKTFSSKLFIERIEKLIKYIAES